MDSLKIAIGLRTLLFLTCVFGFGLQERSLTAQVRTWTDVSGHYKLEAELVGVTETESGLQAEFLMADNKRMAILVTKLCDSDAQLVNDFFKASNTAEVEKTPVEMPGATEANSEKDVPDKDSKDESKEHGHAMPEDSIVVRPLAAPINVAASKLDNRNVTNIKFDPETAIRLERDIVRDVKGRPIENPVYTVEVTERELSFLPSQFRKIVDVLRDPNEPIDKKRRSIEKLKTSWPQGRHLGLLKVLINMLSHEDKFLRLTAIDLLANHDSDQSLIYIFARIDDVAFDVRWRAYEVLTQLRDPRVIPELVERLGGADRTKAASVLQVFGGTSAPLAHQWVKVDGEEDVLLSVCQLLGNIGNAKSAEELAKLSGHKSLLVRSQAKNSIKQINRRIEKRASNATTRR